MRLKPGSRGLTILLSMMTGLGPLSTDIYLASMPFIGAAQGAFALFTMSLPPLFPTLLRTTGAGFCYNIGRIIAAAGTVIFGLFPTVLIPAVTDAARAIGG